MASWAQRLSRVGILVASEGSRSLLRSTAGEVQEECRGHAVAQAERDSRLGGGTLCDECVRHGVDRQGAGQAFFSVRRPHAAPGAGRVAHEAGRVTEFLPEV